jgi:hypothetical protein
MVVPAFGFPDATTTGPVAGTVFTPFSGNMNVTTDNAIIENFEGIGTITVSANNVTIRNCRINCSGQNFGIGQQAGFSGMLVTRCEVYGLPINNNRPASHVLTAIAVDFDNVMTAEISFCNVHGIENAIGGAKLNIHDNFLHDFAIWQVGQDTDHTDGVQSGGNTGAVGQTIVHNTIIGFCTFGDLAPAVGSSCIALQTDMHDVLIENNFLSSGSNTIYGNAQNAIGSSVNTIIRNNHFSNYYASYGGGVFSGFNPASSGFIWNGNIVHETGATVPGPSSWPN